MPYMNDDHKNFCFAKDPSINVNIELSINYIPIIDHDENVIFEDLQFWYHHLLSAQFDIDIYTYKLQLYTSCMYFVIRQFKNFVNNYLEIELDDDHNEYIEEYVVDFCSEKINEFIQNVSNEFNEKDFFDQVIILDPFEECFKLSFDLN